jgi:hypothetical protein
MDWSEGGREKDGEKREEDKREGGREIETNTYIHT